MPKRESPPSVPDRVAIEERDRLELIRFDSGDARLQAIGALIDYGMLNFTSYSDADWLVRTPIAQAQGTWCAVPVADGTCLRGLTPEDIQAALAFAAEFIDRTAQVKRKYWRVH